MVGFRFRVCNELNEALWSDDTYLRMEGFLWAGSTKLDPRLPPQQARHGSGLHFLTLNRAMLEFVTARFGGLLIPDPTVECSFYCP